MRHVRTVGLAVAVVLCIVGSLILAVAAASPSSDSASGRPSADSPGSDGAPGRSPVAREIPVQDLKEVNYYPAAGGWTYMWSHFDPTAIDRDFARARALDANTVRIIVQPMVFGF